MPHDAPEPLDDDAFERITRRLIDEAENYTDQELRPAASDAWRRFYAQRDGVDTEPAEGGSELVMSEVKDATLGYMPELMELFAGSDLVVEYYDEGTDKLPPIPALQQYGGPPSPVTPDAATRYANAVFWECGGWRALHDACMEAVVAEIGFLKSHVLTRRKAERLEGFVGHPMHMDALLGSAGIDVHHAEPVPHPQDPAQTAGWHVKARRYYETKKLHIEAVAASDMILTAGSDIDALRLIGEKREVRRGELVAMGIEPHELEGVGSVEHGQEEQAERARTRVGTRRADMDGHGHWSLEPTMLYEVYPLVDRDGDGLPERWRVLLAGPERKMLRSEQVDDHPYSVMAAWLIPGRLHGMGLGETCADLQEARTRVVRDILDNADAINNPLWLGPPNGFDRDGLVAWRREKVVTERIPGSVRAITVPPIINQLMPVNELLDQIKESRIGQSRVAQGLDPDALQNTTATAAMGTLGAAQRKQEMVARSLAEVGLKDCFRKLLRVMRDQGPRQMQMPNGQAQTVDPAGFDPAWGVRAVVGLGNMRRQELRGIYQGVVALQMQIMMQLGPTNPLCNLGHLARALRAGLSLFPNLKPGELFADPDAVEQAMQQQARQPPPPDPKMIEAQGRLQIAQQTAQGNLQLAAQKHQDQTALEQARASADAGLGAVEMAHQQKLNEAELMHEMALRRVELDYELQLKKLEIEKRPNPADTNVARPR